MASPGKASYKPAKAAPVSRAQKKDAKQSLRTAGMRAAVSVRGGMFSKPSSSAADSLKNASSKGEAAGMKPKQIAKQIGKGQSAMNKRTAANTKKRGRPDSTTMKQDW
jgi:hypothetical protein